MKNVNQCYLNRAVKGFVLDLIRDYEYRSFDALPFIDKCEFAGLLLKSSHIDNEHEFLTESNHLDQTIGSFTKTLMGIIPDDEFVRVMKENTVKYFEETMSEVFDYVLNEYESDKNFELNIDKGVHYAI